MMPDLQSGRFLGVCVTTSVLLRDTQEPSAGTFFLAMARGWEHSYKWDLPSGALVTSSVKPYVLVPGQFKCACPFYYLEEDAWGNRTGVSQLQGFERSLQFIQRTLPASSSTRAHAVFWGQGHTTGRSHSGGGGRHTSRLLPWDAHAEWHHS